MKSDSNEEGEAAASNVMTKIISLIYSGEELAVNMAELVKSIVAKGNF